MAKHSAESSSLRRRRRLRRFWPAVWLLAGAGLEALSQYIGVVVFVVLLLSNWFVGAFLAVLFMDEALGVYACHFARTTNAWPVHVDRVRVHFLSALIFGGYGTLEVHGFRFFNPWHLQTKFRAEAWAQVDFMEMEFHARDFFRGMFEVQITRRYAAFRREMKELNAAKKVYWRLRRAREAAEYRTALRKRRGLPPREEDEVSSSAAEEEAALADKGGPPRVQEGQTGTVWEPNFPVARVRAFRMSRARFQSEMMENGNINFFPYFRMDVKEIHNERFHNGRDVHKSDRDQRGVAHGDHVHRGPSRGHPRSNHGHSGGDDDDDDYRSDHSDHPGYVHRPGGHGSSGSVTPPRRERRHSTGDLRRSRPRSAGGSYRGVEDEAHAMSAGSKRHRRHRSDGSSYSEMQTLGLGDPMDRLSRVTFDHGDEIDESESGSITASRSRSGSLASETKDAHDEDHVDADRRDSFTEKPHPHVRFAESGVRRRRGSISGRAKDAFQRRRARRHRQQKPERKPGTWGIPLQLVVEKVTFVEVEFYATHLIIGLLGSGETQFQHDREDRPFNLPSLVLKPMESKNKLPKNQEGFYLAQLANSVVLPALMEKLGVSITSIRVLLRSVRPVVQQTLMPSIIGKVAGRIRNTSGRMARQVQGRASRVLRRRRKSFPEERQERHSGGSDDESVLEGSGSALARWAIRHMPHGKAKAADLPAFCIQEEITRCVQRCEEKRKLKALAEATPLAAGLAHVAKKPPQLGKGGVQRRSFRFQSISEINTRAHRGDPGSADVRFGAGKPPALGMIPADNGFGRSVRIVRPTTLREADAAGGGQRRSEQKEDLALAGGPIWGSTFYSVEGESKTFEHHDGDWEIAQAADASASPKRIMRFLGKARRSRDLVPLREDIHIGLDANT